MKIITLTQAVLPIPRQFLLTTLIHLILPMILALVALLIQEMVLAQVMTITAVAVARNPIQVKGLSKHL
jgi:hypothetical protein